MIEFLNQFLTILSGIVIPRYVILVYGSEVNGLSSSITQLLNILNFLQAGAVSAAVILMYGPMQKKDYDKLKVFFVTTRKHFKKLALIFFGASLIAGPLFAKALSTTIPYIVIIISVYLVAIKMAIDLVYTYPFRALFNSDERNYIMSYGHLIEILCSNIISVIIISFQLSFVYIYLGLNIGCILKNLFLYNKARRLYTDVYNNIECYHLPKLPNSLQSLLNELSISLVMMSPSILIALVYDLQKTSIYYIYNLVFISINTIMACVYGSYNSRMGIVYASKDEKSIRETFDKMQYILFLFGFGLFTCAGLLYKSFIQIYTEGSDIVYYNQFLTLLMSIMGISNCIRIPYSVMISATGLFTAIYKSNVILSVLSVVLSVYLVHIRFEYICLGPIIYYLLLAIIQNYILSKYDTIKYSKKLAYSIIVGYTLIIMSCNIGNKINITNGITFIIYGACTLLIVYPSLYLIMKFIYQEESTYFYNLFRR